MFRGKGGVFIWTDCFSGSENRPGVWIESCYCNPLVQEASTEINGHPLRMSRPLFTIDNR